MEPAVKPKKKALMPRKINGRFELSTYCIDALHPDAIWALLQSAFGRGIPARSDFKCEDIRKIPLETDPNWVPERHVDILGWPLDEDGQASRAQALVAIANGHLATPGQPTKH